ncbi:type I 3-dehydroquinate dehydratase [Georgenia faecalis]|uniref:3-dehydroquinate dehydratase n=2 Tax=Georgenia faecalis TaxID=2483799 RepID=A0ABV9D7C6_9MICO
MAARTGRHPVRPVMLRGVPVGGGPAKVAASLTSAASAELVAEAGRLVAAPVDVAEWRVDHFAQVADRAAVLEALAAVREALGDVPLVATVRGAAEGGNVELGDDAWASLAADLVTSGHVDALDVEVARPSAVVAAAVASARAAGVAVLASSHDLTGTPPAEEILARLERMVALGADLAKVAVTAHRPADVLALLAATAGAAERLDRPVITMAMGPLGVVTRIGGEAFGSSLTFGALDRASAPGQVPVAELRAAVDLIHRQLTEEGPR